MLGSKQQQQADEDKWQTVRFLVTRIKQQLPNSVASALVNSTTSPQTSSGSNNKSNSNSNANTNANLTQDQPRFKIKVGSKSLNEVLQQQPKDTKELKQQETPESTKREDDNAGVSAQLQSNIAALISYVESVVERRGKESYVYDTHTYTHKQCVLNESSYLSTSSQHRL